MLKEIKDRLTALWFSIQLTYRLVMDTRVPMYTKAVPLLTVFYILSPIDIIPDFLLALGQLDDLLILTMGFQFFENLVPAEIVEEHRQQLLAEQDEDLFEPETL